MKKAFTDPEWRKYIPVPIYDARPEYIDLYYKAWEIAHMHVRNIEGMPQDPYMDEAFCDTQLWIWDTCFMSLFCKFAPEVFPGVETFKNFYEVLYDGRSLPKVIPSEREPEWTGAIPGVPSDIYIHIADNPPLFAWGEYENALISADTEHIKDILYNKKYLEKHYEWIEGLKSSETPRGVMSPTCLISEELGYRWEGGRSGMDNTPRGRDRAMNGKERPNNPSMLWIDAICQQALSAHIMEKLYLTVNDTENAEIWSGRYREKKDIINKYYWNAEDGFYYDIDVNTHEHYKVKTIASFWTLICGAASRDQAKALLSHIEDPESFGGAVPLISLARSDRDYLPDGRYWRGGLWLPTAYMTLKGLSMYSFSREARAASMKIIDHMLKTYNEFEPHTIWECYAPEAAAPARVANNSEFARPDFCGWSALGPISIFIEYILGFSYINAFDGVVEWNIHDELEGALGIKNLRFGDTVTDITAKDGECTVVSNKPYTLKINGVSFSVKEGRDRFKI